MSSGDPQTRKRILETTRRLIEGSEGRAVRLQDIADAAGVSRQAIYLHFGSRAGLMVATVQFVDEAAGFMQQTAPVREEEDSLAALDLFVDFWAAYLPTVYPLAKRLYMLRASDEGAAAAWQDRMDGLRNGPCRYLVKRLEEDEHLAPEWSTQTAVDVFWTLLSVQTWENLVIERGWAEEAYATHLKRMVRRVLTARTAARPR